MSFRVRIGHAPCQFHKGRRELHLTQSAISRQIAQLEDFLGRSLFVREHRSLRLTIAGERYAKHVQWLLNNCSEATLDVMKRYGDQELTVASSGVAVLWLTPRLGAFRAAYPNVHVRMIVRDGLASLLPAEFDVGLYYTRQRAAPHFTAPRIFDEKVYPVCSPGSLGGRRLEPSDLAQETLLMQEDGQRQWMSWPEWFRLLVVDGNPLRDISVLTGQGESIEYVFQRREVVSQRGWAVPK
jgi:DNA-binding transcriptional LysR family regulator